MSNRLSGNSVLGYLGTNAANPPNVTYHEASPTAQDYQNFSVGDIWIDTLTETVFYLASKAGNRGGWQQISGGTSNLTSLQGNSGGLVGPTGGTIHVVGDGTTIQAVGTPANSTITLSAGTAIASDYVADTGTAIPSTGVLQVRGGNNIATSASGNTVTVALSQGTDGQLLIGSSTGAPAWANLTAGSNIAITNGHNSITISSSAATTGIVTLNSDTGSATGSTVTIAGGTGITTTASGSNLTIGLTIPVTVSQGGTGKTSFTPYSVICAGTTSTGALQNVVGTGSSGQVLTSNGASALPSWQSGGLGSSQGCFNAYLSPAYPNAIGDGVTNYTIVYQNVSFDDTASYNNATGIFTAPVTGKYYFRASCIGAPGGPLTPASNGIAMSMTIVTPSVSLTSPVAPFFLTNFSGPPPTYRAYPFVSGIFALTAGDQCYVTTIGYTTNNMNNIYVQGGGGQNFAGSLLLGQ